MFDLSILDEEEITLLVGSTFYLLYTMSFAFSLIKLFRKKFTYEVFPVISLFFCFLNGLIWTQYSDLIYHESMKFLFQASNIIACGFVVIYSLYEIIKDIIDTVLNVLILVTSYWAVKKLLVDILKEEEKVKMTCGYAIIVLYLSSLEWTYRAYAEKNTNILNLISALFLIFLAACWIFYGFKYEDQYFLYPNLAGLFAGGIYIYAWHKLKKTYGYKVPIKIKKEEKDDKKEDKDKKDEKDKKEEKDNKEVKEKEEKKHEIVIEEDKREIIIEEAEEEKEKLIKK